MKRLQKIIFALSVIAGIMIGCKNPQGITNVDHAPKSDEVSVTIREGSKATQAVLSGTSFTADITTRTPTVEVTAPKGAEVTIGGAIGKTQTITLGSTEQTKTVVIKVGTKSYQLVLTYKGSNTPSAVGIQDVTVTGANSKAYTVNNSGKSYAALVTEKTVTVRVTPKNSGAEVMIDNEKTAARTVDLSTNPTQTLTVKVTDPANKASESYTVTITYSAADNTNIKKITVDGKDATKISNGFYASVTKKSVTVQVEPEEPEAKVFFNDGSSWKAADNKATTVTFDAAGKKSVQVKVEHGTAAPTESFVEIRYAEKDYSIQKVTVTDAANNTFEAQSPQYGSYLCNIKTKTASYTVVPSDSTATVVEVDKKTSNETVLAGGKGTITFEKGENSVTRYVKVKIDGHSDLAYTLNFKYVAPDLSINKVYVDGQELQDPGATLPYTASVAKKQVQVKVIATGAKTDSNIKTSINNISGSSEQQITLDTEGVYEIPIVISGYGKEQKYTLKLTYENSALAIKTLKVGGKDAVYTPYTKYEAAVTEASFAVVVEAQEKNAAVTIDGESATSKTITIGNVGDKKDIPVVITYNGESKTYTLTVTRVASGAGNIEAALQTLTVTASGTQQTLSPAFSAGISGYDVYVEHTVTSVTVAATAASGITIEGIGEKQLTGAETKIEAVAKVTADPNKKKTYLITVHKAQGGSNEARLKTFDIEAQYMGIGPKNFKWNTQFSPDTASYTCKARDNIDGFKITVVPMESGSKTFLIHNSQETPFTTTTNVPAPGGQKVEFKVKVLASDNKATKTYSVTIDRVVMSGELVEFKGSDLSNFFDEYKNGETISKNFQANIDGSKTETQITAQLKTPDTVQMKIKIDDGEEKDFTSPQTIQLSKNSTRLTLKLVSKLTNEGFCVGETKKGPNNTVIDEGVTYYLTITKKTGIDGNADLSDIQVVYGTKTNQWKLPLDPATFNKNTTAYTVRPPAVAENLYVTVKTESPAATIENWNNEKTKFVDLKTLKDPYKIPITVVASNSTKKTYTITVKQYKPVAITVTTPSEKQTITVTASGAGTVSGSFVDEEHLIHEIWIGSSAFPIQKKLGNHWVQANVDASGKTFTATFADINKLANGARDIKIVAYSAGGYPVAVKSVPVTIAGSTIHGRAAKVNIQKGGLQPQHGNKYEVTIKVYDVEYSYEYENVVVYEHILSQKDATYFNYINESLSDIMVTEGRKYKVQVTVKEKESWATPTDPLKPVASGESQASIINANGSTSFNVTLQRIQ